jgi:hypothetical protein
MIPSFKAAWSLTNACIDVPDRMQKRPGAIEVFGSVQVEERIVTPDSPIRKRNPEA